MKYKTNEDYNPNKTLRCHPNTYLSTIKLVHATVGTKIKIIDQETAVQTLAKSVNNKGTT